MMNFNPSLSPGSPQIVAAEVSPEQLHSLVTQIEEELHCSPVYALSLESLQKVLGHTAVKGEILVRAVGREAIQIALRQMARGYMNTISPQETEPILEADTIPSAALEGHTVEAQVETVSVTASGSFATAQHHRKSTPPSLPPKAEPPEPPKTTPKNKRKKPSKADIVAQKAQQRTDYLQQIAEQFLQARNQLGLSGYELHRKTMVPLSHLEAMETADEAQLPEDVYLRGFICRLGNALGLDGTAMAAALPAADPIETVKPSWTVPEPETEFYLNSVHLYLGYAALLAGSIGGIAWLSQQSLPENRPAPNVPEIPAQTSPQSYQEIEPEITPGLQNLEDGIVIGTDIVHPETSFV